MGAVCVYRNRIITKCAMFLFIVYHLFTCLFVSQSIRCYKKRPYRPSLIQIFLMDYLLIQEFANKIIYSCGNGAFGMSAAYFFLVECCTGICSVRINNIAQKQPFRIL